MNIKRLTEEDSIFWFNICGWIFSVYHKNNIGSSDNITTPVVTGH